MRDEYDAVNACYVVNRLEEKFRAALTRWSPDGRLMDRLSSLRDLPGLPECRIAASAQAAADVHLVYGRKSSEARP